MATMATPQKRHYILPIPFLFLGLAFVVLGIYVPIDNRAVVSRAIRVTGVVTKTVQHTYGRDWRLSTFSRFQYKTRDGRTLSHLDEFPDSYEVGEHITVIYDPQNSRAVYIGELPPWSWKVSAGCILVGVFFLGGAVLAWAKG